MEVETIVRKYLPSVNIMQLATSSNGQPWVCSIHYYSDEDLNLYWISTPERRHSLEIKDNPKVSATIMVHEDTTEEDYVIGITIEGTAELIGRNPGEEIIQGYNDKLKKSPTLLRDVQNGTNPHQFYKMICTKVVLFDNSNFPEDPRQEWIPNQI